MAVLGRIGVGPYPTNETELEIVVVDHDPTSVATDTSSGSLIIRADTGEHFRKLDDGASTNVTDPIGLKNNLTATVDPVAGNDNTQDYTVGSVWVNVTADTYWVCVDASTGAAVWRLASVENASELVNDSNVNDSPNTDDALNKLLAAVVTARGLVIANSGGDPTNDIDISPGVAIGSGGEILELTATITKQIDVPWAEGSPGPSGGLFTGTVAADTVYHVFIIRKDSDGTIDAGFDTSVTAANIPVGWTAFKRVGSIITVTGPAIKTFTANEIAGGGLEILWDTLPDEFSGATSATAALLTLTIPTGVKMLSILNIALDRAGGGNPGFTYFSSPDQTDEAPSATVAPLATIMSDNQAVAVQARVRTDTSGQVRYRSGDASGTLEVASVGFVDERVD
jgi:hypothetical protein